ADVVGMTGVPEVVLAREAGLCYATVALVTNMAAGISQGALSHDEVVAVMDTHGVRMRQLVLHALDKLAHADAVGVHDGHHLVVAEGALAYTRGHVGHQSHGGVTQTRLPGQHHLRHPRHPHHIG